MDDRQHAIYRETACRKRKCRTTKDFREYQIWHMGIQKELDELKARKKELMQDIRLGTACIGEIITDKETFVETDDVMDKVANNLVMGGR